MSIKRASFIIASFAIFISACVLEDLESVGPSYFRVMLRDDPSSTISIGWNTGRGSKKDNIVYYDTEDHGDNIEGYRYSAKPHHTKKYKGMNNAFVRLRDLSPDTKYYFIVDNSNGPSARMWFQTLSEDSSKRLSLIAGGDSRDNPEARRKANLLAGKLRADVILFGGDMTSRGRSKEWKNWFQDWQLTIADDGRMTPVMITRGNHENSNKMLEYLFDTPNNVYYALNLGGGLLRAYVLNTEMSMYGDQTNWLAQDLKNNANAIFKMAIYHRPMRPHVIRKGEGDDQYDNWAELFYQNNMNLVVESDSHTVKSTWPLRPDAAGDHGFIRDDQDGTVFVGEGCWGAPLRENDDAKTWTRSSDSFNQFKWIFVDRDKMEIRTIKIDNAPEVEVVDDEFRFRLPANLDVWNPVNGEVIIVE